MLLPQFIAAAAILQTPPIATTTSFQRVAFSKDLDVLFSPGCKEWRDRIGVLQKQKSCDLAQRVVNHISDPDFVWTTDRHALYPTTDCEVFAIPWLEAEMSDLLEQRLFPAIASLFDVDERKLFLRDQFVVKYSSDVGAQRGLESHYDESCFSYVMQLNDPSSFVGGGTLFDHAEHALSVPQGDTVLFCGYTQHTGVQLAEGTRYILTGFVDYRADVEAVRPFYGLLPGDLPRPYGAGSNDFPSPHLTVNIARLSQAYDGLRGDALLRLVAYSPPRLDDVDLTQLRSRCANWLEHGMVPNERFYTFLQASIGHEEGNGSSSAQGLPEAGHASAMSADAQPEIDSGGALPMEATDRDGTTR